jgi:hypothetical protein
MVFITCNLLDPNTLDLERIGIVLCRQTIACGAGAQIDTNDLPVAASIGCVIQ